MSWQSQAIRCYISNCYFSSASPYGVTNLQRFTWCKCIIHDTSDARCHLSVGVRVVNHSFFCNRSCQDYLCTIKLCLMNGFEGIYVIKTCHLCVDASTSGLNVIWSLSGITCLGEVINRSCANDIQVDTSSPGVVEIIFILMHIPSCSLI